MRTERELNVRSTVYQYHYKKLALSLAVVFNVVARPTLAASKTKTKPQIKGTLELPHGDHV